MSDSPRKGSLLVIFLTVFIDLLGFGMVLPLLPVYARDFGQGLSDATIGWMIGLLMASFSAMQFICAPLWGRLSDRIGRRPVLIIGLAGSVIFYTLFGVATVLKSLAWLFVARIGAGIAGATISTAQAYIADTTTPEKRAKGMALIGAAFGLGFTFGPLFGFLAMLGDPDHPGPWPGYAAAGLSAFALLLAIFKLPESVDLQHHRSEERKLFQFGSLIVALRTPSVGMLLLTLFVAVLSFANFESTLSLFLKSPEGAFQFSYSQLLLVFAFVGLVLTIVQGGIVRRLAGTISEVKLTAAGAIIEVAGFAMLIWAHQIESLPVLFAALTFVTSGFAFMTPSINSLISRRSDPTRQGSILGVAQSVSSLARIVGPVVGAKLFMGGGATWPFWLASALMGLALVMILLASRGGQDYAAE